MLEYVSCRPGQLSKPGAKWGEEGYVYGAPEEWRDNEPFEADLALTGHWRGRSSARVGVKDVKTGTKYSMGFASFYDAVDRGEFKTAHYEPYVGKVLLTGRWQCRKQGANYILVPLEAA